MKKILIICILAATMIFASSLVNEGKKAYKDGNYFKAHKLYYSKAIKFYKKACDGGNIHGCSNLGLLYTNGQGVKQNYFKANKLFKKACDGGDAIGCSSLGLSYENGKSVKQSYFKAKELFGKACDGGYQIGCTNYAILNKKGY